MLKKIFSYLLLTIFLIGSTLAQGITLKPKKPTASQIFEDIKKLSFLGSVLYVAAHPDDENTTAISYFANTVKARTAYLSLTRGDGGQNIVGPELRELLGVMRTQELLAARTTDGGEQRFTRANDFGYSKHPDETLAIWNKDEVLSDVVWAIRTFKPDVIINRFNHRTPGTTHGHHTSSAMLSVEAYDLAGDKSRYSDQLQYTDTWQPKRQFFNTSWWFYGGREEFEKADKSNLVHVDVGTYYPGHGLSNTEISSLSRSQHKSQGFGNTGSRGESDTYFEVLRGSIPSNNNIFDGIDTSWNRIKGGTAIGKIIAKVQNNFNFQNPGASVAGLAKAYNLLNKLPDSHWKGIKKKELKKTIAACTGLYLEGVANTNIATIAETVTVKIEAINRSNAQVTLNSITGVDGKQETVSKPLLNNKRYNVENTFTVTSDFGLTNAYWLNEPSELGMYTVKDRRLIGKPETPKTNTIQYNLTIEGVLISYEIPIVHKYNDRVKGEVYQSFEVVPEASVALEEKVQIYSDNTPRQITVSVTGHAKTVNGNLSLQLNKDWKSSPASIPVRLSAKNESQSYTFTITPPTSQSETTITPVLSVGGKQFDRELVSIDYDHIPLQSLFLPAFAKAVKINIKRKGNYIGYIQGAGDAVAKNLEQIGYKVAIIKPEEVTAQRLEQFDAVVIGIRAYNVVDEMQQIQSLLLDYVKKGGTMIAQYNTSGRSGNTKIGAPYPIKLSRDRVTDEYSDVRILAKDHLIMNFPNKIGQEDFKGWTQERGLYFPNEWASEYTPILSMNDKGEEAKEGSLLVAQYGKGHYIYTGLSFFRELPAGVAGAYRLFANMLSIGKNDTQITKQ